MKPPTVVDVGPKDPYGTLIEFPSPEGGSAFAAKAASAAATSSTPSTPAASRSLYSGHHADVAPVSGMPTGPDPRRAAPPETSKWWESGQGLELGTQEKPEPKDLVNIRPLDLREEDRR